MSAKISKSKAVEEFSAILLDATVTHNDEITVDEIADVYDASLTRLLSAYGWKSVAQLIKKLSATEKQSLIESVHAERLARIAYRVEFQARLKAGELPWQQ